MSGKVNQQRIESGFARALENANRALKNGMERVLEWGMNECLRCHDERHRNHFDMGDGYGWILFHNGDVVSEKIYGGGYGIKETAIKSVKDMLDAYKPDETGWVGVVMASMQPRAYFVITAEKNFIHTAVSNMRGLNFSDLFKAV